MKKIIKKLGSLALIGTLVLSTNLISAYTNQEVKVAVDGRLRISPDVNPFIDNNGRTQVPIRFVSEELGSEVDWDGATKTVTIERGDSKVEMTIGKKTITVDGTVKQMDTAPQLYQGRTVVPIRFVSEGLGVEVNYIASESLVDIRTENYGKPLPTPTLDVSELGATARDGYGIAYDSIEFPIVWADDTSFWSEKGIIYDITLKNDNEVWLTTNVYKGTLDYFTQKPTIQYAGLRFYNSKDDSKFKNLSNPKGITTEQNKPEITYNVDGTITYMLETYENDKYPNNDFTSYSNYDRVLLGSGDGKINIPVSLLVE